MVHHFSTRYSKRMAQKRRRIYIISGLVIIAFVFIFVVAPHIFGEKPASAQAGTTEEELKPTETKSVEPGPAPSRPEPQPELPQYTLDSLGEPNSETADFIKEIIKNLEKNPAGVIKAREKLNEVLSMPMNTRQLEFVKQQFSKLSDKWLFSRTIFPKDRLCSLYNVRPGDQLRTIGREHKVPYEILMEINNITDPRNLRAGEMIKVINGPFHARIYRSRFTMDLYLQNTYVRSFKVGLGLPGRETPTGLWVVKPGDKLEKPTWYDKETGKNYESEDPDYPLGSRWIGLKGLEGDAVGKTGIAFHGTNKPDEIGTAGSRGCIRLDNGDAILVYNLMMEGLSQVVIED